MYNYSLDAEISKIGKNKKSLYFTNALHLEFRTKKEALKLFEKIDYPNKIRKGV
jgi:hypothetical protein